MTTLAVIPARLAATRLPRKPLRLLGGEPLVVRVWERVVEMRVADRCVIATDSSEVAAAAEAAGAECVITSAEHPSGTDRIAEVAERPEFRSFEIVVNVQGDEPFVVPQAVHSAAGMVATGGFPIGTAAATASPEILSTPQVVKVVTDDKGAALYFSRAGIPFLRDQSDRPLRDSRVLQHIGVYAYTREALRRWVTLPPHPLEQIERLEQLRPLAAGMHIGVAIIAERPLGGVDTEDDLTQANTRWAELSAGRVG